MPLTREHRRQIAQFLLIVQEYLRLAEPARAEREETLGMTKRSFMPGEVLTAETRTLAIVGAHLSSAAIRLASIEDVLDDAGEPNQSYTDCRTYFRGDEGFADADPRAHTCSEWFHVMLRDNAAHEEPPLTPAPNDRKRRRWRNRQNCIERTSFAAAYAGIQAIDTELRDLLRTKYGIVPVT